MNKKVACIVGGIAVLVAAAGVVTAVALKKSSNKE